MARVFCPDEWNLGKSVGSAPGNPPVPPGKPAARRRKSQPIARGRALPAPRRQDGGPPSTSSPGKVPVDQGRMSRQNLTVLKMAFPLPLRSPAQGRRGYFRIDAAVPAPAPSAEPPYPHPAPRVSLEPLRGSIDRAPARGATRADLMSNRQRDRVSPARDATPRRYAARRRLLGAPRARHHVAGQVLEPVAGLGSPARGTTPAEA